MEKLSIAFQKFLGWNFLDLGEVFITYTQLEKNRVKFSFAEDQEFPSTSHPVIY